MCIRTRERTYVEPDCKSVLISTIETIKTRVRGAGKYNRTVVCAVPVHKDVQILGSPPVIVDLKDLVRTLINKSFSVT